MHTLRRVLAIFVLVLGPTLGGIFFSKGNYGLLIGFVASLAVAWIILPRR